MRLKIGSNVNKGALKSIKISLETLDPGLKDLTGWFGDEWRGAGQLGLVLLGVNRRFGGGARRSRRRT